MKIMQDDKYVKYIYIVFLNKQFCEKNTLYMIYII